jgi:5-methyltetrahydropteroyltriglutamate--homocysteine methyltransferase
MNEVDAQTRAETVGSLLRPAGVPGALASDAPEASEVLDAAVLDAISIQTEAGLDIITDGEMRRTSWAETPRYLDCFEKITSGRGLHWRGGTGTAAAPPAYDVVVRRVSEATRLGDRAGQYAFLAEHAEVRTKFTMAAPSYHRRYWSAEHSSAAYDNIEDYLSEVRDYLREVAARLVGLGCDYIQLDAPNYGSLCDAETRSRLIAEGHDIEAEIAFDAELDNSLFAGVSGVTRALHICRGNSSGGRWHSAGGYGAISASLFGLLDFDRLLLEYDSDRAGTFGPLSDVKPGVVAVLGLLTTKSGELEDVDQVRGRVAEAATVKPLDELAISTQCGFASVAAGNPVTPEQQQRKLELVARLARETWPAGAGEPAGRAPFRQTS